MPPAVPEGEAPIYIKNMTSNIIGKVRLLVEMVTLEKYQIIENDQIECYQNWNKCFKKDELQQLLSNNGFQTSGIYSDVAGKTYHQNSDTIAIIANKK